MLFRSQEDGERILYHNDELKEFIGGLPFELTNAQKRVVNEICRDMRQPYQMNRLLQGDVGSGKTIVAAIAIYAAITAGSYISLLDKYPQYFGGFIWDFIDQALLVKDPISGQEVMRYGGDFDDRHSDYEFSGDGLMFADRTPKPAMQEVRYYYGLHK